MEISDELSNEPYLEKCIRTVPLYFSAKPFEIRNKQGAQA